MPLISIDNLPLREIFPVLRARVVPSTRTSQSLADIDPGVSFPEHQHPHEQTVNVLERTLDLVVAGEPIVLPAGQSYVIPPDVPHAGRARTACRVLDVFAPVREDYR